MAPPNIIDVGEGFWNVRGSFKIGGLVDIGTHASLVRRASGKYVFLDACDLDAASRRWVDEQTGGGEAIEAFLHLHPFHTSFVRRMHERYPNARLYGTARHARRAPELPWEAERTEEPALHALFGDDFDFSVPRGVELIPANESLHFSSVLTFHRASKTLHVDDTLNYVRLPKLVRAIKPDVLTFHPALAKVLEPRAGAAGEFRDWTSELVERARSVENLCTAHMATLLARDNDGAPIARRVEAAVRRLERRIRAHERKFG